MKWINSTSNLLSYIRGGWVPLRNWLKDTVSVLYVTFSRGCLIIFEFIFMDGLGGIGYYLTIMGIIFFDGLFIVITSSLPVFNIIFFWCNFIVLGVIRALFWRVWYVVAWAGRKVVAGLVWIWANRRWFIGLITQLGSVLLESALETILLPPIFLVVTVCTSLGWMWDWAKISIFWFNYGGIFSLSVLFNTFVPLGKFLGWVGRKVVAGLGRIWAHRIWFIGLITQSGTVILESAIEAVLLPLTLSVVTVCVFLNWMWDRAKISIFWFNYGGIFALSTLFNTLVPLGRFIGWVGGKVVAGLVWIWAHRRGFISLITRLGTLLLECALEVVLIPPILSVVTVCISLNWVWDLVKISIFWFNYGGVFILSSLFDTFVSLIGRLMHGLRPLIQPIVWYIWSRVGVILIFILCIIIILLIPVFFIIYLIVKFFREKIK